MLSGGEGGRVAIMAVFRFGLITVAYDRQTGLTSAFYVRKSDTKKIQLLDQNSGVQIILNLITNRSIARKSTVVHSGQYWIASVNVVIYLHLRLAGMQTM